MDTIDTFNLAVAALNFDLDDFDEDAVERELMDLWGIDLETFGRIGDALLELTVPGQASVSGAWFRGFVKDGLFVVKKPIV